ncbi:mechanosensitive ion channel family protein [Flavobacterium restrictum]|uniref:Mechanosensitive ion channel family protein n=2 Tax=Flavobacterium restrictum TaxID=2594428 RepID=A0A553EBI6_9FLAO|nr:mechanosensitive ion channel family protein [Flavobacterium restrictum]
MVFSQVKITKSTVGNTVNRALPQTDSITKTTPAITGFPVVLSKDTLLFMYQKIGSFTAQNRAKAISERITQLYEDPFFEPDSLQISTSDLSLDLVYKRDFIILSVTDFDAKSVGLDRSVLMNKNRSIITKAILFQKANNTTFNFLKRIALELLFLGLIGLVLYFINVLFRRLKYFLIRNDEKHFKGVKLNNFNLLSTSQQLQLVLKTIDLLRIAVLILTVYLSLPLLFSVFPATEEYTTTLLNWILKPAKTALMGFVAFLPNLFSILVIVFLFKYALKIIKYFVDEIQKENINIDGFYSDWAKPTFHIVKVLMYAFMLVIIFPYLPGSDSPIFKGVTVFVGVLFSIGSSNAIANMVAGLVITYMRPFKIGDFIKIGDVSGEVIEKTALVTRIRTPKKEDITIPNATVLSSSSINFSANTKANTHGLVIHTTVTIGYDVPWKSIHQALINAALRTDLLEKEPQPFVLQTSLDDFYVSYEINAYTKAATQQPLIYSHLHQNIQDCFNEEGIEIMSPHYKALRDGNKTTIPENYLSTDVQTPVFVVKNK